MKRLILRVVSLMPANEKTSELELVVCGVGIGYLCKALGTWLGLYAGHWQHGLDSMHGIGSMAWNSNQMVVTVCKRI